MENNATNVKKVYAIEFSKGSLNKNIGSKKAPEKIINQTKNQFLNENNQDFIFDLEKININQENIEEFYDMLEKEVIKINQNKVNQEKLAFLGGDHSITYSLVKALKPEALIIFDAHLDVQDSFKPATHEDYLRILIEEKIIEPKNIFIIGIRNQSKEEYEFINSLKQNYNSTINIYNMNEVFEKGIQKITKKIIKKVKSKKVYLSIDFDVLDSTIAYATGYPEPAGFQTRELIYMLQHFKDKLNLYAFDLVEYNPVKDIQNIGAITCAKILKELF